MNLSERIRRWLIDWNVSGNSPRGREIEKFADEVAQLEGEIVQLEKDAAPFQNQINQRKTYKTMEDLR